MYTVAMFILNQLLKLLKWNAALMPKNLIYSIFLGQKKKFTLRFQNPSFCIVLNLLLLGHFAQNLVCIIMLFFHICSSDLKCRKSSDIGDKYICMMFIEVVRISCQKKTVHFKTKFLLFIEGNIFC